MTEQADTPQARAQFGAALQRIRVAKGFATLAEIAAVLKIDAGRYARYERGELDPSLSLVWKMCEVLGVSPNTLLGFPIA